MLEELCEELDEKNGGTLGARLSALIAQCRRLLDESLSKAFVNNLIEIHSIGLFIDHVEVAQTVTRAQADDLPTKL